MAFCTKCGAALTNEAEFCGACGHPVTAKTVAGRNQLAENNQRPGFQTTTVRATSTIPRTRPPGVTVLAILTILSGIGTILAGLGVGLFSAVTRVVTDSSGQVVSVSGPGLAGIGVVLTFLVLLGVLQFAAAYGFLVGANWSWWLGMIAGVLSIISILGLNLIGFVIGIMMVYYLTRPHVKEWFHQR